MVTLELERVLRALGGGALIGLAATLWLLVLGRICGISGILAGVLPSVAGSDADGEKSLRAAFLVGLIGTGFALHAITPAAFGPDPGSRSRTLVIVAIAGLAVGIGTRIGGGCTSGHGVCGISRGSTRSLVATITFMGVAILTVWLRRTLGVAVSNDGGGSGRLGAAAVIGAVFALGLGISGMANPGNILAFLDITGGHWDPTLMFVMGGAILVHAPFVRIARGRARPWHGDRFAWPSATAIDARLVGGAALFGVGWGLSGYCPGPALVGLGSTYPYAMVFVAALIVGSLVGGAINRRTGTSQKK